MANEVKKKVLLTLQKLNKKFKGSAQYVIEVVSFNDGEPVLIKQQYYYNENEEEWLPGKLKGFTYDDLKFLKNKEERTAFFDSFK